MKPEGKAPEPQMDAKELYREEVFTDRKTGVLRRLAPIKPDGSPDAGRKVLFVGEAQLLTNAGALPLSFEIDAANLEEAAAKYGPAVQAAFNEAMEELREMRRRASSSLVLPQGGSGGMGPGGLGPGGLGGLPGGGGSRLKLR
ncbi:MAG: hypothetical protein WC969_10370 [Elusimicrobiota bacterium]|jgi:hypothetical protein